MLLSLKTRHKHCLLLKTNPTLMRNYLKFLLWLGKLIRFSYWRRKIKFGYFLKFPLCGVKYYSLKVKENLFLIKEVMHSCVSRNLIWSLINRQCCKEFDGFGPMVPPYEKRRKIIELGMKPKAFVKHTNQGKIVRFWFILWSE